MILPDTGRWQREALTEGAHPEAQCMWRAPSTACGGPPPRVGEDFSGAASRLAGLAGALLGWRPHEFWTATPAELAAILVALGRGRTVAPPAAADLARLQEMFPDG